jgi:hypothetical protein
MKLKTIMQHIILLIRMVRQSKLYFSFKTPAFNFAQYAKIENPIHLTHPTKARMAFAQLHHKRQQFERRLGESDKEAFFATVTECAQKFPLCEITLLLQLSQNRTRSAIIYLSVKNDTPSVEFCSTGSADL